MWWRALLYLVGLLNIGWGVYALASPVQAANLIELGTGSVAATGEVRAVWGGLVIMLGVIVIAALRHRDGAAWLRGLALVFVGLVVGRAVSLFVDGFTRYTVSIGAFEAVLLVLFLYAARRLSADASN